ncbi:putative COP9 subunit 3 [Aspergillus undulatus]|uniref:putative COP9 subunit 3 n=1 Tax=Aspergillus undulatus TaxID=1810928 RepID=UPI003CCD2191
MSDFLGILCAVPSRQHSLANTTDESYDRQLRDLLAQLKQPGLIPSTVDLNEHLEAVNPAIHSLSFLYLLRARIQQLQKSTKRDVPDGLLPGGSMWKHCVRFLRSFDPIQIRYAGHEWRQLVELLVTATLSCAKPVLAVKVVRDALIRINTSGVFTSMHLTLVKLALLSSSYTYALPVMDNLLCHFPTGMSLVHSESLLCSNHESNTTFLTDTSGFSLSLSYRDHLQFYLYSAMIYMALKKWDQASHCLSVVISSPTTNSVSKIMVEAYKKWVLANLLGHGKLFPTPSIVAPHVARVYQSLARPYISLAEAFEKGGLQKLSAEVNIGHSIWRADNNSGLVHQVLEAYDKFMIIELGRTFSALTMRDVLQRTSSCSKGPHDIEEFVVSLVLSDALTAATLSHALSNENTALLRFSLSTQKHIFREEHIHARLLQWRCALNTIAEGIAQTDHTLELSQENLHFIARNQKWTGSAEKSGAPGPSEANASGDIDEDLMGDAHS